jgi:hypothetical protein
MSGVASRSPASGASLCNSGGRLFGFAVCWFRDSAHGAAEGWGRRLPGVVHPETVATVLAVTAMIVGGIVALASFTVWL